jgi:four helix bundle protein
MAIARSFPALNVYRQARETAQRIFELSREFPLEERYSLTDQVRRSSRAVKAMIAEAWGLYVITSHFSRITSHI